MLSRREFKVFRYSATILASVTVSYLAGVAGLYFLQDQLIFAPMSGKFNECPAAQAAGFRAIDQRVGAERIRILAHTDPGAKGWILVFHGNDETTCTSYTEYGLGLLRLRANIALVEYPGYQDDATPVSQQVYLSNTLAAYDWIESQNEAKLPLFLFGRSLGTGFATYVASVRPAAGLILVSPYTSIVDAAQSQYPFVPVRPFVRSPIPSEEWAPSVKSPVLVIHGSIDREIPIELGRRLSRAFPSLDRFLEIPGAGHEDIVEKNGVTIWKTVEAFYRKYAFKNASSR